MAHIKSYFTKFELALWGSSSLVIAIFFILFDRTNYLTLAASLIGVTSLIFNAKGNSIGQVLMIVFSLIYGYISFLFGYYGEMITYLGMTMPMAVVALVSWLKNPFEGNKTEVKVNSVSNKETVFMWALSAFVTAIFYYVLKYFHTDNLVPSTISVTTSFIAAYLTFRRSPYFALAYASNDIVLIILWSMASVENIKYISVVACFAAFLFNDLYGFINWRRIHKRQIDNG